MTRQDVSADTKLTDGGALRACTVICFSHLRWDFVFQRPQHLMSRFAKANTVIFWEEPVEAGEGEQPEIAVRHEAATNVTVATPRIPAGTSPEAAQAMLASLLDQLTADVSGRVVAWYYTPMMLPFSRQLRADCTVYDCMDELANFRFAPPELLPLEQELLDRVDLVFTGGYSLYEAKRDRHSQVFPFPSSVDRGHFQQGRASDAQPADQVDLSKPRLGFYGVIDERIDLDLLAAVADARPDWSLVMVGPVVKISQEDLPRRPNIHYLGNKDYTDLPAYLSGWDVALMPFAINDATRFISPTKTPEYLAAGRPVVSTPITDVIRHYGELEGVFIAGEAADFIAACEAALALKDQSAWLTEADGVLATMDWDNTVAEMWQHIEGKMQPERSRMTIVSPTGLDDKGYDVLIVGAGFAGSVTAERFATQEGKRVLVVDRRPHIAGNAYDRLDDAGILMHQYGPHIFHTNSTEIFDYLSQFTDWRPYEHRVLAKVDDKLVPIPINRNTLNVLYGLDLKTEEEAADYLASRAEPVETITTSEDVVVSAVGRELYEKFFRGYTRKQWGLDPSELDRSVTARVPTRTNADDRYFTDRYQFMPAAGYTAMFERMLDHPNIDLLLGTDYRDVRDAYPHAHLVYTGPIDEFFDHRFGKLPYRSLRFEHETVEQEWYQQTGTVNYPDESVPYTRISEYKYLTGQDSSRTTITREYPAAEGDPYYPIPRPENQELFKRYEALARARSDVTFVGRLATYRYYNMDQIVGQALAAFRRWQAAKPVEKTQRELIATAA
jgi:UDP-galactopyranose mutase